MLSKIDDLLNQITMYRLVLYGLGLLTVVVFTFSITGALDFEPIALLASLLVVMVVGFVVNRLLGRVLQIPLNYESGLITCFILFFLVSPTTEVDKLLALALATIVALASKFFVTYHKKHIFNPAAFGLVVVGLIGFGHASWWVGSSALWPFTLVLGLLVARKLRRTAIVIIFWVASLLVGIVIAVSHDVSVSEHLELLVVSSPLIFLGSIMLTEPSTMPPRRSQQLMFAVIAAALFASHPGSGLLHVYPETALLIANIYAFALSDKRRYVLKYLGRHKQGPDSYEYEFESDNPLHFSPGQYMEVTMPLGKLDDRGNRRTFTIASAPSENTVRIGVRIPDRASCFKQGLATLKPGQKILAGQVAGSFTLPKDASKKLLFIAGGVGITPFRSMTQDIIDTDARDVQLVYAARSNNDFMYTSVFDAARNQGVKTQYVPGAGPMSADQLSALVPDITQRLVYISGPPAMTRHFTSLAMELGVSRRSVKTDYFAGY